MVRSLIQKVLIGGPHGFPRLPRVIRWGLFAIATASISLVLGAIKPVPVSPAKISLQGTTVNTSYKTSKPSHKTKAGHITSSNAVEASSVPAAPFCTPAPHYQLPSATAPLHAGLQTIIDTPHLYTVYGNTPGQINSQIARCTPVVSTGTNGQAGKYAANTGNTISWKISYSDNVTGTCQVIDAEITLHIGQSFPRWQPSSGSPVALASTWQSYITKLRAYEQGHVRLDEQWAGKLLTDLENLPPTNCQIISQAATNKANLDTASLLAANSSYDIVNNFGLKQNVVL